MISYSNTKPGGLQRKAVSNFAEGMEFYKSR